MRWQWLAAALTPLVAGLVLASLLLDVDAVPNPVLSARVDMGSLALVAGTVLSLLVGLGLGFLGWQARTCRQRIADARADAVAERRRFLQRLDHELKNPLTAICAGLANIVNGSTETARQDALTSVEAQVLRLSRLTADLRKLAELETCELERTPVDVAQLLKEAVALAGERLEAEARQLALVLPQAPWPVPNVPGDWDLLFLATYNLLDNALKFTRPGDTIEARAFDDRAYVVVEVADTGPGIPDEELPRVWEELHRGQGARGVPGSGLGLALTRKILKRHGGQVRLRSRLGQGTVVSMRLPTM